MAEDYDSEIEFLGDVGVLRIAGEIGNSTAPRFRQDLEGAMDVALSDIIVDLNDVELVDSTAHSVLMLAADRMLRERRQLVLVVQRKPALRGFKILGLRKLFSIVPTVAEARARVGRPSMQEAA